jgi:PPOX class probable F420-dependent enzyme
MNRREQIRMSADEIRAFLAEQRIAAVATIGRDGFPHVVAMWYVPTEDALAFWTYAKSQKAVNLRRDPRLTCLVECGEMYDELRGVQIKGRGEIVTDPAEVRRWGELIWARYATGAISAAGELTDAMRQMIAAQATKRIVVVVRPVAVASWDHRKLGGAY